MLELFTHSKGEPKKLSLFCDICDEKVEQAKKIDGDGIGSIWVCRSCKAKYYKI